MTSFATTPDDFSTPLWSTMDHQRRQLVLEQQHTRFINQWRESLKALIPAAIQLETESVDIRSYADFVGQVAPEADIQVYEIEALQSLCAWHVDMRFFPVAVDCMFGGGGRLPIRDLNRRYTPIEIGVRKRCLDSLATAYESAWNSVFPLRLNLLRQERKVASLRLTASKDLVAHARFRLSLNDVEMPIELCLPYRAVEALTSPAPDPDQPDEAVRHAWGSSLRNNVYSAPIEAVAVLTKTEMTVAQLLSLSLGQVIPIDLGAPVELNVDGVTMMKGRYGVRSGRYALKVEDILETTHHAGDPGREGGVYTAEPASSDVSSDAAPPVVGTGQLNEVATALSDFMDQVQQDGKAS